MADAGCVRTVSDIVALSNSKDVERRDLSLDSELRTLRLDSEDSELRTRSGERNKACPMSTTNPA